MSISKRLRYEILRRDNYACRYCGAAAPDVPLTVDHVVPQSLGGRDEPSNLVTACRDCNGGKAASAPDAATVADVDHLALQWAAAMQQAADERGAAREFHLRMHHWFRERWERWTWTDARGHKHTIPLPDTYATSLDTFINAGLRDNDFDEFIDAAMAARTSDEWRYFCGCCWRRIREYNDRAAQIMEEDRNG